MVVMKIRDEKKGGTKGEMYKQKKIEKVSKELWDNREVKKY